MSSLLLCGNKKKRLLKTSSHLHTHARRYYIAIKKSPPRMIGIRDKRRYFSMGATRNGFWRNRGRGSVSSSFFHGTARVTSDGSARDAVILLLGHRRTCKTPQGSKKEKACLTMRSRRSFSGREPTGQSRRRTSWRHGKGRDLFLRSLDCGYSGNGARQRVP